MEATQTELDAILHGAAIAPISAPGYELFARSFLRITGPDATRWLNGMVTNSVQALAPGEGNYNFLLNAQGRIQADCTIYRELGEGEPSFLVATDSSQLEALQNTLDRYIIMDDVELTSGMRIDGTASSVEQPQGLSLLGPRTMKWLWEEIWDKNEFPFVESPKPGSMTQATAGGFPLIVLSPSGTATPHHELWFPDTQALGKVMRWPSFASALQVSPEALEAFRILSGTPRYGRDIRNSDTARDLPQETDQTHALHFSKGCYLGQEIVERIRSRGQVHKLFTRFRLDGDLPPTFPAPLQADGKPAGELTSAAIVPLLEGPQIFALGYARREFLEAAQSHNKHLTYAGGTAVRYPASKQL